MIRYIQHDEINRSKWDICVDDAFNGLIYAKSWYLDVVAEQWDALIENDYEKIFPLVYRKKYGIHYIFQPIFTQQLGLFSKTLLTEKSVQEFIQAIPKKFKHIELNLNTLNKLSLEKIKIQEWLTHELDLINSYNNIRKNYSSNLKRNLTKAGKSGLVLAKSVKPDDIIKLFRENRGKLIQNLQNDDYLKLSRLTYSGIYKGVVTTYGVYTPHNTLCAGAIFLQSKKKIIFLFSGLSEEGKKLGAMPFLLDSFIRENEHKHLTLDFEGSNDVNLARFYKSFGSAEINYLHLQIDRLNPIMKLVVGLVKKIKG